MADHSQNTGALETGAAMDYSEHNKTYSRFLMMAKWGTIFCVALMASMAFGFFIGGAFSGTMLFLAILALAYFMA